MFNCFLLVEIEIYIHRTPSHKLQWREIHNGIQEVIKENKPSILVKGMLNDR